MFNYLIQILIYFDLIKKQNSLTIKRGPVINKKYTDKWQHFRVVHKWRHTNFIFFGSPIIPPPLCHTIAYFLLWD